MRIALYIILALLVISCAQKKEELSVIDQLYRDYEVQPSPAKATTFLDSLDVLIVNRRKDKEFLVPYITKGIEVAKSQNMIGRSTSYLMPLLRNNPDLPERTSFLVTLGDILYDLKNTPAADIVYSELLKQAPDDPQVKDRSNRISDNAKGAQDYLLYLYDQILVEPDEFGLNKNAALKYVDAVEAKALAAPLASGTAGHLYGAAEIARSLKTFDKAIALYDWVLEDYAADTTHAPNALFIKGYSLEQDFRNDEAAREAYTQFLSQYPTHRMAGSATFLLENLGKSDEEILAELESKRKGN